MPRGEHPNSRAVLKKNAFTTETAREYGLKGAEASNKVKREKRTLAEELRLLLEEALTDSKGQKVTTQKAISVSMIRQAMKGNTKAYEIIRDTIGQKPVEKVETTIKEPRRFEFVLRK